MNTSIDYRTLNKAQLIACIQWAVAQKQNKLYTDLQRFIPFISPKYYAPVHLKPITDELNKILQGDTDKRIAISVPPRHGKTDTLLHFIAAYLRTHPNKTVAYMTYSQTEAEGKTINCFDYCKLAGLESSDDMANRKEHRFKNGSRLLTTSISGRIEGEGIDLFIIDDPYSGQEAAESRVQRDSIWNWYISVAENRLTPTGSIVISMHRWHMDDLVGRLLNERKQYIYFRIPAIADIENDLLGRKIGEPLWEVGGWTLDKLLQKQIDGKHTFSTEWQGIPLTDEERLIKGAYYYDELPEGISYSIAADLAYSTENRADFSAVTVMGCMNEKRYILFSEHWKSDLTTSIDKLKAIQNTYHSNILLEANGAQKGIFETVQKAGIRLQSVIPVNDKLARSRGFSEAWNSGNILIPKQATWLSDYLNELYEFTGIKDKHDDILDSSVYAYNNSLQIGTVIFF